MKERRMLHNEKGFTLVEIIAVLILLGILAAVAVPRYIDLQDQARTSAAQAAVAELKGQASSAYGKLLLANSGTEPSVASIVAEMNTDLGSDFGASAAGSGSTITITVSTVQGTALSPAVTDTWVLP